MSIKTWKDGDTEFSELGDISVYEPTSASDPIRYFNGWKRGCGGYYFYDECWCELYGPWATIEECKAELLLYANGL